MAEAKTEGLMYKGHPLRRIDNLIYYGTMADKYIVMMQILESKKENGLVRGDGLCLYLAGTGAGRQIKPVPADTKERKRFDEAFDEKGRKGRCVYRAHHPGADRLCLC